MKKRKYQSKNCSSGAYSGGFFGKILRPTSEYLFHERELMLIVRFSSYQTHQTCPYRSEKWYQWPCEDNPTIVIERWHIQLSWKKKKSEYSVSYMDYIANSKNRKFKKQIHVFLDRVNFWAEKLPISGRLILLLTLILGVSLFFPWFRFEYFSKDIETYSAFSYFTGYIGYAVVLAILLIPFFLLSHTKKEKIRSIIPFRLSDTQVVVFISSMILVGLLHLLFMVRVFTQFATPQVGVGTLLAISSSSCIIIAAFFLSRKTKEDSIELRHLDHHRDTEISDEYAAILGKKPKKETSEDGNMVLPI